MTQRRQQGTALWGGCMGAGASGGVEGGSMEWLKYGDDIIASYSSLSSATPTESLGALEKSLARINS